MISIKDNLNENSEELRPGQRRSGGKHSEPKKLEEMSKAEIKALKKEKKQKRAEEQKKRQVETAKMVQTANQRNQITKKIDQRGRPQSRPKSIQMEHKKRAQMSKTMSTSLTALFLSCIGIGIILILTGASMALANTSLFVQSGNSTYFFTSKATNFYNGLGILGIGIYTVLVAMMSKQLAYFICSSHYTKKLNTSKLVMCTIGYGISFIGIIILFAGATLLISNSNAFTISSVMSRTLVSKSDSLYTGLGLEGMGIFFTLLPLLVARITKLVSNLTIK